MKKKITKNQVFGFGLAIATPFIIAACDDKPKDNSCKCPNGTEHENLPCCDGTGCTCTEKPKPKETNLDVKIYNNQITITINYMALPNADKPSYVSQLETRFVAYGNNPGQIAMLDALVNAGGKYTVVVEYGDDIYTDFVSDKATKTIKVHHDWVSTLTGNNPTVGEMVNAFNVFITNVMMNNMIRMADRYDSPQHIVSGTKLV